MPALETKVVSEGGYLLRSKNQFRVSSVKQMIFRDGDYHQIILIFQVAAQKKILFS